MESKAEVLSLIFINAYVIILHRFRVVAQRSNLKLLIHESMMDIFRKYTNELEQIQAIYEENKVIYVYNPNAFTYYCTCDSY